MAEKDLTKVKNLTAVKIRRSAQSGKFVTVPYRAMPSLVDPGYAKQLALFKKEVLKSKATSREFLVDVGIITPKTHKLTKRYGG